MGLVENLALATQAVAHVTQERRYGNEEQPRSLWAFNNADAHMMHGNPLYHGSEALFEGLRFERAEKVFEIQKSRRGPGGDQREGKAIMKYFASQALLSGAGNCQVQAAVAFRFLKKQGARNVDVMTADYVNAMTHKDDKHSFVVIGRPDGTESRNAGTWGADAVACDAWSPEGCRVYPVVEIMQKLTTSIGKFELS